MNRVVYLIEGINFMGGAHVATASLISELRRRGFCIDVLTNSTPTAETRERFGNPKFYEWRLPMHNLPWLVRGICKKIRKGMWYPDWTIDPGGRIRKLLSQYDSVCVMSEMSPLRQLVSNLPDRIRRVQLIHNDYLAWSGLDEWTRWATKFDAEFYARMTKIAVVGDYNVRAFTKRYPFLTGKVKSFYNVIDFHKPLQAHVRDETDKTLRIVTIARVDESQKASSRSVRVAMQFVKDGFDIDWTFIGAGYEELASRVAASGLTSRIHFPGIVSQAADHLPDYDLLALFSHYEGVPMVVYEAFVAGIPVVATAVSGLRDQVQEGINGWLFDDDEEKIVDGLRSLLSDPRKISSARENLRGYQYDNEKVIVGHIELLGLNRGNWPIGNRWVK